MDECTVIYAYVSMAQACSACGVSRKPWLVEGCHDIPLCKGCSAVVVFFGTSTVVMDCGAWQRCQFNFGDRCRSSHWGGRLCRVCCSTEKRDLLDADLSVSAMVVGVC